MKRLLLAFFVLLLGLSFLVFISTSFIAALYAVFFSIIGFVTIGALDNNFQFRISIPFSSSNHVRVRIIAVSGLISSVLCLVVQDYPQILGTTIEFLYSLHPQHWVGIISSLYLVCLFPGLIVISTINMKIKEGPILLGLSLCLSYVIACVSFTISRIVSLNPSQPLLISTILIVSGGLSLVAGLQFGGKYEHDVAQYNKRPLAEIACWLLVILVMISAYIVALTSEATDYALSGDVARYIRGGELFFRGTDAQSPYIWFQVYVSGFQRISQIPVFYGYSLLQFLVITTPLSIYSLVRILFQKSPWIATFSTIFTTVSIGLTSLAVFWGLGYYLAGPLNAWSFHMSVIDVFGFTTNGTQILTTQGLDIALSFQAVTFAVIYFKQVQRKRLPLLLAGTFLAAALVTHSIFIALMMMLAIMIWKVNNQPTRLLELIITSLTLFLLFELLSGFYVISYFWLFIDTYFFLFVYAPIVREIMPLLLVILIVGIVSLSYIIKKMNSIKTILHNLWYPLKQKRVISTESVFFYASILIISILVLAAFQLLQGLPAITSKSLWYVYVVRDYSVSFFVLSLGLLTRKRYHVTKPIRDEIYLILCISISMLLLASLGFIIPDILNPSVWSRRFFSLLCIPLGIFAGVLASEFFSDLNGSGSSETAIKTEEFTFDLQRIPVSSKTIKSVLTLAIIAMSMLSYAHLIEYYYLGSISYGDMPYDEQAAYMWIQEHSEKNEVILTFSEVSRLRIASICQRNILAYGSSGQYSNHWIMNILFNSSDSTTIVDCFQRLEVRYVVLFSRDYSQMDALNLGFHFRGLVKGYPKVFSSGDVCIYEVTGNLNQQSNLKFVKSVLSEPESVFLDIIEWGISKGFENVTDGISSDSIEVDSDSYVHHSVWDIVGHPSYFAVRDLNVHTNNPLILRYSINGTSNSQYNLGFYSPTIGWSWISGSQQNLIDIPEQVSVIEVRLSDIIPSNSIITEIDFACASTDGALSTVTWSKAEIVALVDRASLGSGFLMAANTSISVMEDITWNQLEPNSTYFMEGSQIILNSLQDDIINGLPNQCNIIFQLQDTGSLNEFGFEYAEGSLAEFLGISFNGYVYTQEIVVGENRFQMENPISIGYAEVTHSNYTELGYYLSTSGQKIPLLLKFSLGSGHIFFLNSAHIANYWQSLDIDIILFSETIMALCHEGDEIDQVPESRIPLPQSVLDLTYPTITNIFHTSGLENHLLSSSDVHLSGAATVESEYSYIQAIRIESESMILEHANGTIENLQLTGGTYLSYLGGKTKINCTDIYVPLSPNSDYVELWVSGISSISLNVMSDTDSGLVIYNGTTKYREINEGIISFSSLSISDKIPIRCLQPSISIDQGSIDMVWVGLIWHNEIAYTTVSSPKNWILTGTISFEVIYVSGNIILRVETIEEIDITI